MNKKLGNAYFKARQHKRWKTNTLQFGYQAEKSLNKLKAEIKCHSYHIKPSLCFIAFAPVKREIFAGDFSDRVIHHYLFETLNPHYDSLFINDCYSCRQNKGTGYGISRSARFMRAVSLNYTKKAFVLKLDIKGYFMNINRQLLYQQNKKLVKKIFAADDSLINESLYLLKTIIFNDPTANCHLRGQASDWQGLPKNKSLFSAPAGHGLPIGNLTSQLFGNVYLNDFDHFVKEKLKCRYYGRYVDDMVFFHQDKEFLKNLIPQISHYLQENLGLEIHPKKIYLQDCRHGLPFLGAIIKPHRIYSGKRLIKNFYRRLSATAKGSKQDSDRNMAAINSYLGNMKKYPSFKRRQKIMTSQIAQQALSKLQAHSNRNYSKIEPNKGPIHS
jgi:RNA-directed DNA polymerase